MTVKSVLCLALLSVSCATAASSGFLLGSDYTEWLPPHVQQIAADSSGALYILSTCAQTTTSSAFPCVTKLSPDGKTILWQQNLGFRVEQLDSAPAPMAVDPNGDVYLIPAANYGDTSIFVAKLRADGSGLAWTSPIGDFLTLGAPARLAVDSQGRAYVAGGIGLNSQASGVVRLNAAGSAVDYTAWVPGAVSAIAVDATGAAFVAGSGFLGRLEPDGWAGFYATTTLLHGVTVAADAAGNAVVYGSNGANRAELLRFDSTGVETLSQTIPGASADYFAGFAVDAAGNAYLSGFAPNAIPIKNSVATCGSDVIALLGVYAPDGSLLQATYIPGATGWPGPAGDPLMVATGPNSTVFVLATAGTIFSPTQAGPFLAGFVGENFLWHLSPNSNARTSPLACVTNAASLGPGAIAPGELVTLFGSGLGPGQGIQTQATLVSPYPTQAEGVEVTFDGTPAPLLWVQDAQINAVAPWALTPGETTQVCVSYNNAKPNCLAWPVVETAPGVFTVDGVHAAAVNQDGTVNAAANPAPVGSIVSVFATGLGAITPAQADGTLVVPPLPANVVLPVGVQAPTPIFEPCHQPYQTCPAPYIYFDVTYAGPAPYVVAGVSRIDFRAVDYAPVDYQSGAISVTLPSTQSQGFQVYVAGE